MILGKRAQVFQSLLHERGLDLTIIELLETTHTADDATRALNCDKAQIVKSLVRAILKARPILILASGTSRVSEKAIGHYLNEPVTKADAAFVRDATGYAIGGVPPFGHKHPMTIFVDEDLLNFPKLLAAAGAPNAVFKIPRPITSVLPGHRVISIK